MAAAIPVVIAAASATMSAEGQANQGLAEQNIASANAKTFRVNATNDETAAAANAAQVERNSGQTFGQAQANAAASGVQASGSPLAVMHNIAANGELSRQLTLYQGRLAAKGETAQGVIAAAEGKAAQSAGMIRAGSTLLTSAAQQYGNLADQYDWLGG